MDSTPSFNPYSSGNATPTLLCDFCGTNTHTILFCPALGGRSILAYGVPASARCCERHEKIKSQLEREKDSPSTEWVKIPQVEGLFDQDFIDETALFPICNSCSADALGRTDLEIPREIDNCSCAQTIISSACWLCEVERIQESKRLGLVERLCLMDPQSGEVRMEILCECKDFVAYPELARKCVGCSGLVTKPFRNYARAELEFQFASVNIDSTLPALMDPLNATDLTDREIQPFPPLPSTFPPPSTSPAPPFRNARSYPLSGHNEGQNGNGAGPRIPRLSKPRTRKTVFHQKEIMALEGIGLAAPDETVPVFQELNPYEKVDLLLLANRDNKMRIENVRKMLQICGFLDTMIGGVVKKVEDGLRKYGREPQCLGVLHHLRENGWAQRT